MIPFFKEQMCTILSQIYYRDFVKTVISRFFDYVFELGITWS